MNDANHYHDEKYKCSNPDCTTNISTATSHTLYKNSWKCTGCSSDIHIYASLKDRNQVIIRKMAKDIVKDDHVHITSDSFETIYYVLGTSLEKNGQVGIGLKGYTKIRENKDKFLNTITGSF